MPPSYTTPWSGPYHYSTLLRLSPLACTIIIVIVVLFLLLFLTHVYLISARGLYGDYPARCFPPWVPIPPWETCSVFAVCVLRVFICVFLFFFVLCIFGVVVCCMLFTHLELDTFALALAFVAVFFSLLLRYKVGTVDMTPTAVAYIRARNADPMSSFGDFAAVSDIVDEATARVLKREVREQHPTTPPPLPPFLPRVLSIPALRNYSY